MWEANVKIVAVVQGQRCAGPAVNGAPGNSVQRAGGEATPHTRSGGPALLLRALASTDHFDFMLALVFIVVGDVDDLIHAWHRGIADGRGREIELTPVHKSSQVGGSADAAAVLRGMDRLFALQCSEEELCSLGAKLGSDVPFCILGGTMLATGRGEQLRRLPDFPACSVVLAKPPISVSTAWAYQNYDAQGAEHHPDNGAMEKEIIAGNLKGASNLLCNVLESVTIKKYEEISRYKKIMMEQGALASMMSGSGPTVFALADTPEAAERIAAAMRAGTDGAVFSVNVVGRN